MPPKSNNFTKHEVRMSSLYKLWMTMEEGQVFSEHNTSQTLSFYSLNKTNPEKALKKLKDIFYNNEKKIKVAAIYNNQTFKLMEILKGEFKNSPKP